ncbi:hypothetical protein [Mesorhizobium sp. AR02]|uniref:hypothetical protein n=1 Tax=Mesorhizobium sp. AR02 TaxID=2865837 RepID=UPI00216085D7|nr:hypothetical protein [Mesorhizobium sp. AR02]
MRTDYVEEAISVGHTLRVELKWLVGEAVVNKPDEIAGNHPPVLQNHDLDALCLVVSDQTNARKAGRCLAGDTADIRGSLALRSVEIRRFANQPAADLPGLRIGGLP